MLVHVPFLVLIFKMMLLMLLYKLNILFYSNSNFISRGYCDRGYLGLFCTHICPYPSYGKSCGETCTCSKQHCSHEYGCGPSGKYKCKHAIVINIPLRCK